MSQPRIFLNQLTNEVANVSSTGLLTGGQISVNLTTSPEITNINFAAHSIVGGDYWTLSSPTFNYYVWYTVSAVGANPAPAAKTGILVAILSADTPSQVATKTQLVLEAHADFTATVLTTVVTITNSANGTAINAADVNAGIVAVVTQQGTSTFDITAGNGTIVNNYTNPLLPTATPIAWSAFTAVPVTNLATADRTFVAMNSAGQALQQTTEFTESQRRTLVVLGTLGHASRTHIVAIRSNPTTAFDSIARLGDLARAVGAITVEGNSYSANGANLLLNKSVGKTYRQGNNFHVDRSAPDTTTDAAETGLTFNYSYRNGSGGFILAPATTTINATNYDTGTGTLAAVPANKWTVQIIKYLSGTVNGTRIEYGQILYNTRSEAVAAIPDIDHVHNPVFVGSVISTYMVVKQGSTNLQSIDTKFVDSGKFGPRHAGQPALRTYFGAVGPSSGTTVIPFDNTIPLVTEGTQVGTATITPAESVLSIAIDFSLTIDASSNTTTVVLAVFRNTVCIASGIVQILTAGRPQTFSLTTVDSPGTTSPVTYSGRAGVDVVGPTWYVNSTSTGNNMGGTLVTAFSLTEVV